MSRTFKRDIFNDMLHNFAAMQLRQIERNRAQRERETPLLDRAVTDDDLSESIEMRERIERRSSAHPE